MSCYLWLLAISMAFKWFIAVSVVTHWCVLLSMVVCSVYGIAISVVTHLCVIYGCMQYLWHLLQYLWSHISVRCYPWSCVVSMVTHQERTTAPDGS